MKRVMFVLIVLLFLAGCKAAPERAGEEPAQEPPAAAEPEAESAETPAAAEPEQSEETEAEGKAQEETEYHTVQAGDTLYAIGKKYGVPWKEIARANDIQDVAKLKVGQKLIIPRATDK